MSIVRNLKKQYGTFKIDIPQMELLDHGITALVGPSGAGKTSTLRVLSGLDECPSLEWIFQGKDLSKVPIGKRKIGFVFQSLEIFPHMSAEENIRFAGECSQSLTYKNDIEFLIKELNLIHCRKRKSEDLSRGEAQRVALARVLVLRPRILFLDEPFSSLDEDNKKQARDLVQKMTKHYDIPAILVSHDERDVQTLAQTVIKIQNGCLVE